MYIDKIFSTGSRVYACVPSVHVYILIFVTSHRRDGGGRVDLHGEMW